MTAWCLAQDQEMPGCLSGNSEIQTWTSKPAAWPQLGRQMIFGPRRRRILVRFAIGD